MALCPGLLRFAGRASFRPSARLTFGPPSIRQISSRGFVECADGPSARTWHPAAARHGPRTGTHRAPLTTSRSTP
ncbi:hypothetical protein AKJ09_07199 [Labilithrix luteola]|uniref:Uncharacterized protein n=1 Tax=Labilithrix luteola TaxID=1391654 RepID=A0A0K1Q3X3_9BACT|nr:hypothetical protein AKJ09_07199 [Labilithrix luteola]